MFVKWGHFGGPYNLEGLFEGEDMILRWRLELSSD